MKMSRVIGCLLLTVLAVGASVAYAAKSDLGQIDFPNSGAPEAQDAFMRGVLLLHNFEYEDAQEAFEEAQKIDDGFAMAYWGEAMTYNHPLWRQQNHEAALSTLKRFAPDPAARAERAKTERERGYLGALEILYGEGEKVDRDVAYSEAMGALSAKYPDDLEAKAFYALSILGTMQGERDFAAYMRAGAIAEEVFAANELHPGAVHYMIHSYDDPIHAPLGVRAAQVYAKIAPAASHAQHMISHIWVAMGHWSESVDANVKSFEVSTERRKAKGLGTDAINYHSLHWLEYSYLQLGRFDDARKQLEMMTKYAEETRTSRALWYHSAMRAAYMVETGATDVPDSIDLSTTPITAAAADLYASGAAALAAGDTRAAEAFASRMSLRYQTAADGELCGRTGGYEDTTKRDLAVAGVMQDSLRAMIALKKGKTDKAIELFERATAAESALSVDFGPPIIVKPSHELYGEALLAMGKPDAAKEQFELALSRAPRRSRSLAGLVQAARSSGDTLTASKSCAEIEMIYASADPRVREPQYCR